jgi:hypothetical protein
MHNNRLVVAWWNKIATLMVMARPPKDKRERKDYDLRIPLTAEQKEMVAEVARLEGVDMATWARPILLEAVRRTLEARKPVPK